MGLRKWIMAGNAANKDIDLGGKLCVITGASSGIGLETTAALVSMGANVIMAVRNTEKGEKVKQEIVERIGDNDDVADRMKVMHLDLNDLESVRNFADTFKEKYDSIDILINNAACFVPFDSEQKSKQGYEKMFAVNHLGPFLLTWLLLDLLKNASDEARIVNVASDAHSFVKQQHFNEISRLHEPPSIAPSQASATTTFRRYGVTKLCNILFTRKLHKILNNIDNNNNNDKNNEEKEETETKEKNNNNNNSNNNVVVNCLHPGAVRTAFGGEYPSVFLPVVRFIQYCTFKTPEEGAQCSIHVATSPDLRGESGNFYSDLVNANHKLTDLANDQNADELWEHSMNLVKPYL